MVHSDAKRLFQSPESDSGEDVSWNTTYDTEYRSRQQAMKHGARDGTAFASIALPAHYSAITAVLRHARLRLDSALEVDQIIDWGAGTGSGLWCVQALQLSYLIIEPPTTGRHFTPSRGTLCMKSRTLSLKIQT